MPRRTRTEPTYKIKIPRDHAGLIADALTQAGVASRPESDPTAMNFGSGGNTEAKAWKDIWGSGQGVGMVTAIDSVADRVDALHAQYQAAKDELASKSL